MGKNLIIVESPNKVKKIQSFLDSKEYQVISSVGHIRDLTKTGEFRLGVELETMQPNYSISKDKKQVVKDIQKTALQSKKIFLATDPDREGEAIAWHIMEVIKLAKQKEKQDDSKNSKQQELKFERIVFNEITPEAVNYAISNSRELDNNLVDSQESRRILDRMIGFRLSNLAMSKIHAKSAGRVKSVALKMIVDRENKIKSFVPEHWYTIASELSEKEYIYNVDDKFSEIQYDELEEATKVKKSLTTIFVYKKSEFKDKIIKPPIPLEMATYLMGMYINYGMSNAQATNASQSLYEKGLISYPRTDSTRISSEQFINKTIDFIKMTWGNELFRDIPKVKKSTSSQDAHEAIRPVDITIFPEELTDLKSHEQKAYDFIWKTTLKSFMVDGVNTTCKNIYENNSHFFATKKTIIKYPGFRVVDEEEVEQFIENTKNLTIPLEKINVLEHQTKPPGRFNFSSLIKELKENGIGRPSTYSSTTNGLVKYNYILIEKGTMYPTEIGERVNTLMSNEFSDIINEKYTASLEKNLDLISEGKEEKFHFLKTFWDSFSKQVGTVEQTVEVSLPEFVGRNCPLCTNPLIYRYSKYGKFISCSGFTNKELKCKYIESLKSKEPPKELNELCPECGSKLVLRKSRFNTEFVGCSAFPKCRYAVYAQKDNQDQTTKIDKNE